MYRCGSGLGKVYLFRFFVDYSIKKSQGMGENNLKILTILINDPNHFDVKNWRLNYSENWTTTPTTEVCFRGYPILA